jgi:hypothetical protein
MSEVILSVSEESRLSSQVDRYTHNRFFVAGAPQNDEFGKAGRLAGLPGL